jgi:methanogenic corrinoid protein MtbC1
MEILRDRLNRLAAVLLADGRPSRTELAAAAAELEQWKTRQAVTGLWPEPPLMVTATLDDAMGHGLDLIHQYARLAGLQVMPLGLLQAAETVAAVCRNLEPTLLGLTVLQFDTEADLAFIAGHIPEATRIVAGGPVFKADPELAQRVGIHRVAADAADFLQFLLTL